MASAGFRGVVSLAAALAVPTTLSSGEPFPGRDLIVFVTAGVIGVTLLVQAPLLRGWCAGPGWGRTTRSTTSASAPRSPPLAGL
jgi:CPA1 family monovalent cation:H+ antiporter